MTQTFQAVAWTLIHFCWQATVVAAAYRLLSLVLARRSAETRYTAALASLLLMLALAAGTFAWEVRSNPVPVTIATTASNLAVPLVGDFPHTLAPGMFALQQPQTRHFALADLLPWIDGLWIAGVFALSLRSLGGWWHLRRLRLASTMEAPADVRSSFQHICQLLGLHTAVTLRLSGAIDSPMTMGTLRAIVLLPLSAVTSLGPDELEVVLAHELAHVRRADFFWNILQTIAETLFFFHPAIWWLSARIRHERELCCDDLALRICPNPLVYAHALFRLEEQRSRYLRLAMALDGHQSRQTLLARIARILGEPMTRIPNRRFRTFSLASACAGLVVLFLPVPHLLASLNPAPQSKPVQSAAVITPAAVNPAPRAIALAAAPSPKPVPTAVANPEPAQEAAPQAAPPSEAKSADASKPHTDYIDSMKAAGYDVDLDKLISMKIQGVTPEYARGMANAGFGKLSADDLISCKIQGVTPEYIAQLKQQGFQVDSVHDAISFRIFGVTPEFVAGMKAAGFDGLSSKQLVSMRVQGVTPEYARTLKQKFPGVTAEELVQARIFRIDDEFIAQATKHGFNNLPFKKLVQLRISGLLDDESAK
jgi:beta-lactamase regulating signal transducer with metallopeptidase domain